MNTNPILTPTLTVEDLALAVPANDHDRSSARRSRLRAQLKLERARYGSARRRLQSVLDSADLFCELADFGSDGGRRDPSLLARIARAAAAEEDRVAAIGARVSALAAQMRGYK